MKSIDSSNLDEAREVIQRRLRSCGLPSEPRLGLIAGSGLGGFAESARVLDSLSFGEIPGMTEAGVQGHASRWILALANEVPLHLLAGRRHYYEGVTSAQVVCAVRVLALLGVRLIIVSNAAGGLNKRLWPGDLMLIRDHINLQFRNPLIGPNFDQFGPRFPDMSEPYDPMAGAMLRRAAQAEHIALKEGIYASLAGPAYETAAEVEFLRRMGADAVGMSTVPEVIAARHAGMAVLGISLITNSHVNRRKDEPLSHEEVLKSGREAQSRFNRLIHGVLPRLASLVEAPSFEHSHSAEP